ncbi:MAG: YlqD family protein [Peptococcaceae bacterium]|nr:YlqD family protein [Peptococcaceae bacterium]
MSEVDSLSLIRPVLVKVKVTENYKSNAISDLREAAGQMDLELQRLDYHEKRLLTELSKKNPAGIQAAKEQFQQERRQFEDNRRKLLLRLQEVDGLTLGTEVVYGKMESLTDINVGDSWHQVLGVEIVLQDGVVVEIRRQDTSSSF